MPLLRTLRAHVEDTTLAVILIVAGTVWAFVAIASEMLEGELDAFDQTILLGLRNPADLSDPIGPRALEIAMRDLTALGGVTVLSLLTFSVIVMLLLRRQTGSAAVVGVAVLGGQVISHLSKFGFSRPRPDLVPHGVDVATSSFPSGHSMMAAVTYLTLGVMLARLEPRRRVKVFYLILAILLTMLVGVSRVYLGVHWPSDVLAGWAAGAGWALAWSFAAQALARRGEIEPNRRAD